MSCSVFDKVTWLPETGLPRDGHFCTNFVLIVNPHSAGCIQKSIRRALESASGFIVPKGPAADHGRGKCGLKTGTWFPIQESPSIDVSKVKISQKQQLTRNPDFFYFFFLMKEINFHPVDEISQLYQLSDDRHVATQQEKQDKQFLGNFKYFPYFSSWGQKILTGASILEESLIIHYSFGCHIHIKQLCIMHNCKTVA